MADRRRRRVRVVRGKKVGQILSTDTIGTNLTVDDHATFIGYVASGEGKKADVLRNLAHEAILARELLKNSHREAESKIKKLHQEAIETGTQGIAGMLEELLVIGRKLNAGFENLEINSGVNLGINFELLKLLEGVFSMVRKDLTEPTLNKKAKGEKEVEATLSELVTRYEERAVEKVEKVRKEVRSTSLGIQRAA